MYWESLQPQRTFLVWVLPTVVGIYPFYGLFFLVPGPWTLQWGLNQIHREPAARAEDVHVCSGGLLTYTTEVRLTSTPGLTNVSSPEEL